MEEITKMKVDWKKIVVVGALVVLTGLTVGGLTWYVADSGAQDEMEAYKNEISTLETKVAQLEADVLPTEETATTTATTKTYTNTEYDYQLSFDEKWKAYTAVPDKVLSVGEFSRIYFEVPVSNYPTKSNKMFSVTVMNKARYDELISLGGPGPILVDKTTDYYYTYSPNNGELNNDYGITLDDIKKVGDSLKLTNN